MTSTPPRVSLVIPCRNEARHIETCLRSVLAFEPPEGGFEVLVADGMSDDGTRPILERMAAEDARIRVVDNPQRVTPCALNAGIRAARGEVIIRIDAHTEYAPDYVRQCLAVLDETQADNVGGPWVARGHTYLQMAIAAAFASPFAVGGARGHQADYEGPVDTVYLGCWPRAVLERVGMFDEELVRNQDDELNFRLHRAGAKIWQSPRIRSWYTPRNSLKALFRQYFQYGYWKVRVMQKHRMPASLRHLVPGTFVACLILLAVLSPFWKPALLALTGLLALYVFAAALASILTALRSGIALVFALPVVFFCYHFGYGLGYLVGVWDFLIRKRSGRFVKLTRN
jgi:glycosyltransferase involved in cell wall biosynthesis